MGTCVEGTGVGGCIRQDVGEFLQVSGTGGTTLWIVDVGDVPMHLEEVERVSPPGDTATDRAADDMSGGWELGVPTFGGSYGGGGHRGG